MKGRAHASGVAVAPAASGASPTPSVERRSTEPRSGRRTESIRDRGPDGRRHVRAPIRTVVWFRAGAAQARSGETVNVSASGLLLATASPIDLGASLRLRFVPPFGTSPIEASGLVRRTHRLEGEALLPCLTGIELVDLGEAVTAQLDRACRLAIASAALDDRSQRPPDSLRPVIDQPLGPTNRRAETRIPCMFQVRFRSERDFIQCYSSDLAAHGIFIETPHTLEVGATVEVEVDVPGQPPLRLGGTVARVSEVTRDSVQVPGIGVRLVAGDLAEMHALAHELRRPARLEGAIEDFGLADLVSFLEHLGKTARLEIHGADVDGALFFHDGSLVHAQRQGANGREAALALLQVETGRFRVHLAQPVADRTIHEPTMALVLEACRVLDERRDGSTQANHDC